MNTIIDLLDYNEWANRRAIQSLLRSPDEKAVDLMAHLLTAERIWLLRLQGKDTVGIDKSPKLTISECETLSKGNNQELRSTVESASTAALSEIVRYRNLSGKEFGTSVGDILTHVVFHGNYHRGQVARAVRAGGGEPIDTDYITFVREQST